jgi:hypothetical protein
MAAMRTSKLGMKLAPLNSHGILSSNRSSKKYATFVEVIFSQNSKQYDLHLAV